MFSSFSASSVARALLVVLLPFVAPSAEGEILWVGQPGGQGCDHSSIQDAIDEVSLLPENQQRQTVIRVSRGAGSAALDGQALVASDVVLHLEGGYDSCTDTSASGRTTISGTGSLSVLEVDEGSELILEGIHLTGGGGGWGAGLKVDESSAMLFDVEISDNVGTASPYAPSGGGIYVWNGALHFENTTVHHNTASTGGGIYCSGSTLTGAGQNALRDNEAASKGGGISAGYCDVDLLGGHDIAHNRAPNGGGLYLQGGEVTLRSTSEGRVLVRENWALPVEGDSTSLRGGGISVLQSTVELIDVSVLENTAGPSSLFNGGGGLVVDDAEVSIRSSGVGCTAPCSYWRANRAPRGAAVLVEGGNLTVAGTTFEDHGHNDGTSRSTGLIYGYIGTSSVWVEGTVMTDNAVESVFDVRDDAQVTIVDSTLAVNDAEQAIALRAGYSGAVGSAAIYSSIVWEWAGTETFLVEPGGVTMGECVLSNDMASQPAGSEKWFVADPQLIDLLGGNFHLQGDSPAIDACGPLEEVPRLGYGDLDGEERCVDDPLQANDGGTCDLGADETRSYPNGRTFFDGFETGDTSAWG